MQQLKHHNHLRAMPAIEQHDSTLVCHHQLILFDLGKKTIYVMKGVGKPVQQWHP